jgi:hypothetical protein
MVHPVIFRPLIADVWARFPVIPPDTCNVQIVPESGFSDSIPLFPCQYHSTIASHSFSFSTLIRRTNVRCLGTFKQSTILPDIWELGREGSYFRVFRVLILYRHVLMCLKQWQALWGQIKSTLLRKLWVGSKYVQLKINFLSLFLTTLH